MIGRRFLRLVVIKAIDDKTWLCQCDCGNTKAVWAKHLLGANVKSCGCYRRDFRKTQRFGREKLYLRWFAMRQRCENKQNPAYKYYGGRGITVCKRWRSFDNFLEDMGEPAAGTTIERVDNDKGYGPGNCVWASRMEQSQNLVSNHNITFQGKTLSLSAWGRETGISPGTLGYRLKRGWPLSKVFTPPEK